MIVSLIGRDGFKIIPCPRRHRAGGMLGVMGVFRRAVDVRDRLMADSTSNRTVTFTQSMLLCVH